MILLYVLLIAYILAVNFYAFLLVKSLRDKEKVNDDQETASTENERAEKSEKTETPVLPTPSPERLTGKLCITGLLGGAVTIYACMFIFKYKRSDLLLMVLMPLLGVLNIYLWVLLFKSGFSFFFLR